MSALRNCVVCGKASIDNTRPQYIRHCQDCYRVYRDSMRECSICHQKKIPSTLPDFMKSCKSCYDASRGLSSNSAAPPSQVSFSPSSATPYPSTPISQPTSSPSPAGPARTCVDCHQANIPAISQAFIVRCNTCFQRKKYKESGGILDL